MRVLVVQQAHQQLVHVQAAVKLAFSCSASAGPQRLTAGQGFILGATAPGALQRRERLQQGRRGYPRVATRDPAWRVLRADFLITR